jgi:hypothetical protein
MATAPPHEIPDRVMGRVGEWREKQVDRAAIYIRSEILKLPVDFLDPAHPEYGDKCRRILDRHVPDFDRDNWDVWKEFYDLETADELKRRNK